MLTVDELLATLDALAVTPVGAPAVVVPAELVYQVTVPLVPELMFAAVTAKVALPAVPAVMMPACAPRPTVGFVAPIVSVATAEAVDPKLTVK
jgi:hypothetical protein